MTNINSSRRFNNNPLFVLITACLTLTTTSLLVQAQEKAPSAAKFRNTGQGTPNSFNAKNSKHKATAASSKAGNLKISPPQLELQEFSGDFQKWSHSIVLTDKQSLRFRWRRSHSVGTKAVVDMFTGPLNSPLRTGTPALRKTLYAQPRPNHWSVFNWNPFAAVRPNTRLVFRIRLYSRDNKPLSQQSRPVVVKFKSKSGSTPKIDLDTIKLTGIVKPGVLLGPSTNNQNLTNKNSIKIHYRYDLHTQKAAHVRQWLLTKNHAVAANNFWTFSSVKKGNGTTSNRATVRCKKDTQKATKIYAVKIVMNNADNIGMTLYQKIHKLSKPIVFSCKKTPKQDYVRVNAMSPRSGGSIIGMKENTRMRQGNSVLVSYKYGVFSTNKAELRQRPYLANGRAAPNNFWTWRPINKAGSGMAQTRFTVVCRTRKQGPTHVKKLRIMLINAKTKQYIIDRYVPVDFRFVCNKRNMILKKK